MSRPRAGRRTRMAIVALRIVFLQCGSPFFNSTSSPEEERQMRVYLIIADAVVVEMKCPAAKILT